jgi:hypothetical protein
VYVYLDVELFNVKDAIFLGACRADFGNLCRLLSRQYINKDFEKIN